MFPDTITIYNIEDNIYYRKEVKNVFAHTSKIISKDGNGEKYTSVHNVIFSSTSLNDFVSNNEYKKLSDKSKKFTLKPNDIIVFGIFGDVNSLSDIQKSNIEYFLIKSISTNQYGNSMLQNIEVTD